MMHPEYLSGSCADIVVLRCAPHVHCKGGPNGRTVWLCYSSEVTKNVPKTTTFLSLRTTYDPMNHLLCDARGVLW